jgi:hypothetical protein
MTNLVFEIRVYRSAGRRETEDVNRTGRRVLARHEDVTSRLIGTSTVYRGDGEHREKGRKDLRQDYYD